jgi:V/A-type H+-transporting ATPase subunit I
MLLPMARVQIIGTKGCQNQTIEVLQRLGTLQIDESTGVWHRSSDSGGTTAQEVKLRERLAYLLTQVESVLTVLPAGLDLSPSAHYDEFYGRSTEWLAQSIENELNEISPQAQALAKRRDQVQDQLDTLPRYEATLRELLPLAPGFVHLEHYAMTAIWLHSHYREALETITQELEGLTEGVCEIVSRRTDQDEVVAVLIFPKDQTSAVNELLAGENITQVRLPAELAGQPFQKALDRILKQIEVLPDELTEIETKQKSLAENWRPRLLAWKGLLQDYLAQMDVRSNFGQTDHTFLITGWIPQDRVSDLEAELNRGVGNEIMVETLPIRKEGRGEVPVVLSNFSLVRPFEPLVKLLGLPQYGGVDPTPLMALFLPLFFGMILGDIGHGLVLLTLMFYLRRWAQTRPVLRALAEVLMMGSAWSIAFGFLYGEFMGDLGHQFGLRPLWLDRANEVQTLLLFSVGVGAGHMVLAFCLGIWEAFRRRSRPEVLEKAATLTSLVALFLLVGVLAERLPDSLLTPAVSLLVVGLSISIYSLGSLGLILGPLELLGAISNVLSYVRIAAIGLASVYLSHVANLLAGVTGNMVLGLLIATLFHALNIALGAFSPTIQSLRLHYVEFFSKFYKGGGQPFSPFRRALATTTIQLSSTKGGN